MIPPDAAPPDPLRNRHYLEGIRLFNEAKFFQAHESWEEAWRHATGDERRFYQGLIQCAVALEHYRRGNCVGAARLAERFPPKFAGLPPTFMGLQIEEFLGRMRESLRGAAAAKPFEPGSAPKIEIG